MMVYWVLFTLVLLVTVFLLQTLFYSTLLVNVLLLLLSAYLSHLIVNAILSNLPRQVIQDTTDKAVFITGCDSGFGYELAKKLHNLGFLVFAGCLLDDSKGARELREIDSPLLKVLIVDVTRDEDVIQALQTVKDNLDGRDLWAVVNNAGVGGVFSEIEWIPLSLYQKVLEVNTVGVIRVTKAFLPLLRHSQGRVVIVASLAGRYVFPGAAPYAISKHAVLCYADGLRREMKKWNISVHTIEPSFYRTPIMDSLGDAAKNIWQKVPKEIHDSYGEEYYKDFEGFIHKALQMAKPNSKIYEVTNDIIDAVAGISPSTRYVPSILTRIRSSLIINLPSEVQDFVICKMVAPKTPPADVVKSRKPVLKRSYSEIIKKSMLSRQFSLPTFRRPAPPPETKFKYPDKQ